jgi:hypothetical protein
VVAADPYRARAGPEGQQAREFVRA